MRLLPRVTVALDWTFSPVGPVADELRRPFSWCITFGSCAVNAAMIYLCLLERQYPKSVFAKAQLCTQYLPRSSLIAESRKLSLQIRIIQHQAVGMQNLRLMLELKCKTRFKQLHTTSVHITGQCFAN